MRTSCAMMALSVTPLAEDEGVEVDGAVETGGVIVSVRATSVEAVPCFVDR